MKRCLSPVLCCAGLFVVVVLCISLGPPALAQDATVATSRVSVSSAGVQGNDMSQYPSISADGRFVAFESFATNLVAGDTNNWNDIFVHDRQTGQTSRVSVNSGGGQTDERSYQPAISADGRFVAFSSLATNLAAGDTNDYADVFVRDRQTGQTTCISVSTGGEQGDWESSEPSISADGRFVAFISSSTNLVTGDTNDYADVFVRDRQTGQTTRVSVSSGGAEANDKSLAPSISADGRFVAFGSNATNLVAGDTNGYADIFVHDRQTGQTSRVSVNSAGQQGNDESDGSIAPAISADGRFVAFSSYATNLVAGDSNHYEDVFIRDRQTGQTSLVSIRTNGEQGDDESWDPSISADGRFVAFYSLAANLVTGDTNGWCSGCGADIFVRDRQTGQTTRVSVSSAGEQANDESLSPSISGDGRFVAFSSDATNLVAGDTNDSDDVFVHDRGGSVTPAFSNYLPVVAAAQTASRVTISER